jgi:RNA polymerase sigma-70 factor (ECF subfamily)
MSSGASSSGQPASFATTHWSIVLEAGQAQRDGAENALAELCRKYWLPLYAYVCRRVQDTNEAQDLTQEFFTRLLEKEILAQATPERGRFRSFLLTAMQNFLTNEWRKTQANKRGGGLRTLSLDFTAGDSKLNFEPGHDWTAERIFERNWSITLLDHVLSQLRDEYAASGKAELFTALRPFISSNRQESSLAARAEQLQMTEGAVKVAAHRLRKRYRELLRAELAQTVADPADVDDEIAWLFSALAG